MKLYNKTTLLAGCAAMAVLALSACQKDSRDNGLETTLTPAFSIEKVAGRTNTYVVKNTTPGAMNTRWDYDDGNGPGVGKMIDTVFYPDAGTYNVKMQAMGKGGRYYDAAPQPVTVATSDPVAGNIVQGGKMNPEDESKWTKIVISAGVSFALKDGKMVATGGNWGHAAIYQKINVVGGKKYRFGMTTSGSGATDTWLEVYFGATQPTNGNDYTDGGNYIGMNTWNGCGNTSFSGNIAKIGCSGSLVGKDGVITFPTTGAVYLVIKTGGASMGTSGMAVDNVELRGI